MIWCHQPLHAKVLQRQVAASGRFGRRQTGPRSADRHHRVRHHVQWDWAHRDGFLYKLSYKTISCSPATVLNKRCFCISILSRKPDRKSLPHIQSIQPQWWVWWPRGLEQGSGYRRRRTRSNSLRNRGSLTRPGGPSLHPGRRLVFGWPYIGYLLYKTLLFTYR